MDVPPQDAQALGQAQGVPAIGQGHHHIHQGARGSDNGENGEDRDQRYH